MKKGKYFLLSLSILALAGGLFAVGSKVNMAPAKASVPSGAQTVSYDAEDWSFSGSGSMGDHWSFGADSLTYKGAEGWTDHLLLTDQFDTAMANYTISAEFRGTRDTAINGGDINAGIVPWFIDSNNWIFIFNQWCSWDRPSEIRACHIYAKINGSVNVYMMTYEEGWGWHNSSEWHEQWTDGCGILPADGFKINVTKLRSMEAGVASDWIDFSLQTLAGVTVVETYHGQFKLRDTANEANRYAKPKVGFYCQNDVFAISNIAFTHDGYTKDSADGFLSTNAYNFYEAVAANGVCGAIDSDATTKKAELQAAYGLLSAKDLNSLANVTYNSGSQRVIPAYEYYLAYANSLIASGTAKGIIPLNTEKSIT